MSKSLDYSWVFVFTFCRTFIWQLLVIALKCIFVVTQFPDSTSSVRITKLDVPSYAALKSTVHLKCEYDLEGENLYAVKWYKDRIEFYRYTQDGNPPVNVFSLRGIEIDVSVA